MTQFVPWSDVRAKHLRNKEIHKVYALTSSFDGLTWALVSRDDRFEFPAEDGALVAGMLRDEFLGDDEDDES